MKYKITIDSKVECVKEIEADNNDQARRMTEEIAENLTIDDFYLDEAYIQIVDIKIID